MDCPLKVERIWVNYTQHAKINYSSQDLLFKSSNVESDLNKFILLCVIQRDRSAFKFQMRWLSKLPNCCAKADPMNVTAMVDSIGMKMIMFILFKDASTAETNYECYGNPEFKLIRLHRDVFVRHTLITIYVLLSIRFTTHFGCVSNKLLFRSIKSLYFCVFVNEHSVCVVLYIWITIQNRNWVFQYVACPQQKHMSLNSIMLLSRFLGNCFIFAY